MRSLSALIIAVASGLSFRVCTCKWIVEKSRVWFCNVQLNTSVTILRQNLCYWQDMIT